MTVARWGNVCGSRSGAGWYITKSGKDLLATNLTREDFIFDSTWSKIGSIILAGTRSYVPTGLSTVVTWPTQSAPPLAIVWFRKSTFPANRWVMAIAAQGVDFGFTGQQGATFYVNNSGLFFDETSTNTATLTVRYRIYDRYTVPSSTPGTPRPRFLLDTTGLYITPPGITAKTAPAEQHLIHPDGIVGQVVAAGEGTSIDDGTAFYYDAPFNWSALGDDLIVYGVNRRGTGSFSYEVVTGIETRSGNILRIFAAERNQPVKWFVLR
jgi:hypothetical protein